MRDEGVAVQAELRTLCISAPDRVRRLKEGSAEVSILECPRNSCVYRRRSTDAAATTKDGQPIATPYTWWNERRDTPEFDEFPTHVAPTAGCRPQASRSQRIRRFNYGPGGLEVRFIAIVLGPPMDPRRL